jgi:hypothetical protein
VETSRHIFGSEDSRAGQVAPQPGSVLSRRLKYFNSAITHVTSCPSIRATADPFQPSPIRVSTFTAEIAGGRETEWRRQLLSDGDRRAAWDDERVKLGGSRAASGTRAFSAQARVQEGEGQNKTEDSRRWCARARCTRRWSLGEPRCGDRRRTEAVLNGLSRCGHKGIVYPRALFLTLFVALVLHWAQSLTLVAIVRGCTC